MSINLFIPILNGSFVYQNCCHLSLYMIQLFGVRVVYSLVFYVVSCVLLFVCLFHFLPWRCQFVLDLWVLLSLWYLSSFFFPIVIYLWYIISSIKYKLGTNSSISVLLILMIVQYFDCIKAIVENRCKI